jgi:hypothetical protein
MKLADLKKPFLPDLISWRIGSTTKDKSKGMALAYIDARTVMQRLDEVCGPENWQCDYPHAGQKTVCRIGIKVGDEWIWKANGAGDSDIEAEKGALSDAFKRAAVLWGIGQYLYDLDSPWVRLDTKRDGDKVYVNGIAKDEMTRLYKLVGGQSAYALNKDQAWQKLTFQLSVDLGDCHSKLMLDKLRGDYRQQARENGWPKPWLEQLAEEFDKHEATLPEMPDDDTFPGDLPPSKPPVNNLRAG